ncbi:MAG: hypothetical protein Q7W05_13540, partial [Deltaproteobacteria bacterium]|nr:hypothetical protein [Deltaproteobacteria bacterium]
VGARHIDHLLDMAAYAIERIAPTLAKAAVFDLSDFASARRRGVSGYTLTLSCQRTTRPDLWIAEFKNGNKVVSANFRVTR